MKENDGIGLSANEIKTVLAKLAEVGIKAQTAVKAYYAPSVQKAIREMDHELVRVAAKRNLKQ